MNQFSIINTPIEGIKVIERKPLHDRRGFFARIFCSNQLKSAGWSKPIAQINQTVTRKKGTVRGMHFQLPPYGEMKLVSCLNGVIWDVVVDLRKNSPTFLRWHGEILSSENSRAMLIPEGFAHGFQALTDNCELLYLHSEFYAREAESGLRPTDPRIGINWPLDFYEISTRDSEHCLLDDQFTGIVL